MAESQVYVAVHGHFYQPPRENPYLNAIERQDSAHPFHDWNERIFYECYRPNAYARIHNHNGELVQIVNNYEYLSFNMGATLLSWLEQYDRPTYERIIEGDRLSAQRLGGHGNAIAQVYNHIIMPLASWRDKLTQIRWGKADFEHRFGRAPRGMWLAETAIDYETIEALIQEGIRFTILAPSQAQRIRPLSHNGKTAPWLEVGGGQIDPTRPYRCFLKNRTEFLDIFFYDGPISRDMGFGELLSSSYSFAARLGQAVQGHPHQLIAVATDGETFGHHKHFTEKSLAYCFTHEFPQRGWQVTNFDHYLSMYPPEWEVELKPVTAWSCAHGVDRWQDDCGCGAGIGYGKWRRPLRDALNWLRDQIHQLYQTTAMHYFHDLWTVRDEFIAVILERTQWQSLWHTYGKGNLEDHRRQWDAIRLLEMERHSLLSFTSCGWFFEEISRPEGVQILRYAGRAIDLAADVAGVLLEEEFMERLALAPSNVSIYKNGADIYRQCVQTAKVGMEQIAAQFAITNYFDRSEEKNHQLYGYDIQVEDYEVRQIGGLGLAICDLQLISKITLERQEYAIAVLHLGSADCHCVLKVFQGRKHYEQTNQALWQSLAEGSAASIILAMQKHLGDLSFNLRSFIREDRHSLLQRIARRTLHHLDQIYAEVYRDNASLLTCLGRDGLAAPPELQASAQITLNYRFQQELAHLNCLEHINDGILCRLENIYREAQNLSCQIDFHQCQGVISDLLSGAIVGLVSAPSKAVVLSAIQSLLAFSETVQLSLNLEQCQEQFLEYLRSQVAVTCPMAVQVVRGSSELPAKPICESFSNAELQQIHQIAQKLKIATIAWLKLTQ
jgi:alpha-amylase/alpha-mannosidase (GH57 family)